MDHKRTQYICLMAMGIALYVACSFMMKIPLIGHIGLDLGYIVLAIFCYMFGGIEGAIIGACGCTIVSLLMSGWFPAGWCLGNAIIGIMCGTLYKENAIVRNIIITVLAVVIGILGIKTVIECWLFNIPFAVKIPKNLIATIVDSITMCIGVIIAPQLKHRIKYRRST